MEELHSMILDYNPLLKYKQMSTLLKAWGYFLALMKITIFVFQEDSEKLLRFILLISLKVPKQLFFLLIPIMARSIVYQSVQERRII